MAQVILAFQLLVALLIFAPNPSLTNIGEPKPLTRDEIIVSAYVLKVNKKLSPQDALTLVQAVFKASAKYSIDPMLILGILQKESTFKPQATSSVGAAGLMQVMPFIHRKKLAGRDPHGIETSIDVGAHVLSDCMKRYQYNTDKALQCYSGGASSEYNRLVMVYRNKILSQLK